MDSRGQAAAIRWSQVMAGFLIGLIAAGLWATLVYGPRTAEEWYQKGYEAGKKVAPPVAVQALEVSVSPDNWDFSAAVASDGSVAADASDDVTLTITHKGTEEISNLRITMRDPVTGSEGIPTDLEIASFEVYVKTDTSLIPIYKGAEYLSFTKPLTVPGEVISIVIRAQVLKSPAGTFKDNQSYSTTLYVYQPDADYSNSVKVAVLT